MTALSWETNPTDSPDVVHRELPQGIFGYYSRKTHTIYIDPALSPGQYRSTLEHEKIHAERGDFLTGNEWLDQKMEQLVEAEAARRLIDFQELLEGAAWCRSLPELAEHLVVDNEMLGTRLAMLTRNEKDQLRELCERWWHP